jgi:WD40 repeat protein
MSCPSATLTRMIAPFLPLVLTIALAQAAPAAWPPREPMPRLETGMHTARINRIGVDAQERFLVTASDDKTARVWDLESGKLLQVLRVPSGQDPKEGKLYCAALSPNGKYVAAAGWTGPVGPKGTETDIYIFNRATGRLAVPPIGGLPNVIMHLAFSSDGRYLAATLGGGDGLRVYRTRDWSLGAKDPNYGQCGFRKGPAFSVCPRYPRGR